MGVTTGMTTTETWITTVTKNKILTTLWRTQTKISVSMLGPLAKMGRTSTMKVERLMKI